MTYLPKSELAGVLNPSSINTKDIGVNWSNITTDATLDLIRTVCYIGNGISLFGTTIGEVWRSTDYGNTWTNLGDITGAFLVHNICYLGNGIAVLGDDNGHEWRSTDFGVIWTDIGDVSGGTNRNISSFSYLGNGVVILTTHNQGPGIASVRIRISTDYGLTWATRRVDDLVGGQGYESSIYVENSIALSGRSDGHVFRCIDNGNTWTDLGDITTTGAAIFTFSYLGNGIVIFGTNDNHIFRSVDYGATWTDLGDITGSIILSSSYLGNGIVIVSTFNAHIWRSVNFGLSWTDLGVIGVAGQLWVISYSSDGIVIAGGLITAGATKKLVRSDISYKLDENSVGAGTGTFLPLAGGTMSGSIQMNGSAVAFSGSGFPNTFIFGSTASGIMFFRDASTSTKTLGQLAITTFTGLTDTPSNFTGSANKLVAVNTGETALEFTDPSTVSLPGQLKPAISPRYTMPGWMIVRDDDTTTVIGGFIYYVPFFVATTTIYTDTLFYVTGPGGVGSIMDIRIFTWNDGVPDVQLVNVGAITTTGAGSHDIVNTYTLTRGFYFMAFRNNLAVTVASINWSFPVSCPVSGVTTSTVPSTNFLNNVGMTVNSAYDVVPNQAPAPTAVTIGFPIFRLKDN